MVKQKVARKLRRISGNDNSFRKDVENIIAKMEDGTFGPEDAEHMENIYNSVSARSSDIQRLDLDLSQPIMRDLDKAGLRATSSDKNGATELVVAWIIGGLVQTGDVTYDVNEDGFKIEVKSSATALMNDCSRLSTMLREVKDSELSNAMSQLHRLHALYAQMSSAESLPSEVMKPFYELREVGNFDRDNWRWSHSEKFSELRRAVSKNEDAMRQWASGIEYDVLRRDVMSAIDICVRKPAGDLFRRLMDLALEAIPEVKGVDSFVHVVPQSDLTEDVDGTHRLFFVPAHKFREFYVPRAVNRGEVIVHPEPFRRGKDRPSGVFAEIYEVARKLENGESAGVWLDSPHNGSLSEGNYYDVGGMVVRCVDVSNSTHAAIQRVDGTPNHGELSSSPREVYPMDLWEVASEIYDGTWKSPSNRSVKNFLGDVKAMAQELKENGTVGSGARLRQNIREETGYTANYFTQQVPEYLSKYMGRRVEYNSDGEYTLQFSDATVDVSEVLA